MKFSSFNLKEDLVVALEKLGYKEPTEVQKVVIPKALKNENIIVQSETGSGKTHSFLIPILNNLEFSKKIQAIVILPTRELARQTYNFFKEFLPYYPKMIVKMFLSGEDSVNLERSILNGCEVVIATPGKLNELLKLSSLDLSELRTIVLDEADMLVDKTFLDTINTLLGRIENYQLEVFSATISKNVEIFLKKYISPDYILTLNENNSTSVTVNHHFINTKHQDVKKLVLKFISVRNPYLLLIFANSRKETQELYEYLHSNGINCGILSGDLESRERKSMLRRINNGDFRYVVCSDIASRGLDIKDVSDVLSIGLPNNLEYYYHRAGRAGRNFKSGDSYIFYDQDSTKLPLELIDRGLKADYLKFENDSLIEDLPIIRKKKQTKKVNEELELEIRKAKNSVKSKKVKPGYKKKLKLAAEKVKRKYKRNIIKQDIRRQRVERYKSEAKNNGR